MIVRRARGARIYLAPRARGASSSGLVIIVAILIIIVAVVIIYLAPRERRKNISCAACAAQ